MVQAWFMDDVVIDQRLPHKKQPSCDVSFEELKKLNVLTWKIDADNYTNDETYSRIKKERGYSYEDEITCSPEKLPNYEEKLKSFFKEHLHADEEIRFVLDGSGYFDVRDKNDNWIRIAATKGDMLVLPAGIYHRFTLDEKDYIRAKRLFVDTPVWTPINRPADEHPARLQFLKSLDA
eukprot:gene3648-4165_t